MIQSYRSFLKTHKKFNKNSQINMYHHGYIEIYCNPHYGREDKKPLEIVKEIYGTERDLVYAMTTHTYKQVYLNIYERFKK